MRLIYIILVLSITACSSKNKDSNVKGWAESMQNLANNLNEILPYAFNEETFKDPKNQATINKKFLNLKESANTIPDHIGKDLSGNDPLFQMGLIGLRETISKSHESFQLKNYTYSQSLIQGSANYCFKCHISSNLGPRLSSWENFKLPENTQIHPLNKSKLLIATRQFAKAEEELLNYINKQHKQDEVIKKETAFKLLLATSLRVETSPAKAIQIINKTSLASFSPVFQKSVKLWETQLQKIVTRPKMTDTELEKLFNNKAPILDGRFIKDVILASRIHDRLPSAAKGPVRAKLYNNLGDIYSNLGEISFWELPENYYEACINDAPKTKIAQTCFKNLKDEITLGFSGSSGVHIPAEASSKLESLKKLAF